MVNLCIDRRGKGMEEGTNGKVVSVSRIHSSFRTCYIYIYFEHLLRRTRLNVLLERINKREHMLFNRNYCEIGEMARVQNCLFVTFVLSNVE